MRATAQSDQESDGPRCPRCRSDRVFLVRCFDQYEDEGEFGCLDCLHVWEQELLVYTTELPYTGSTRPDGAGFDGRADGDTRRTVR